MSVSKFERIKFKFFLSSLRRAVGGGGLRTPKVACPCTELIERRYSVHRAEPSRYYGVGLAAGVFDSRPVVCSSVV